MLRMCSSPQVIDTVVVAVVVVVALQNQLSTVAPWRLLERLLTILLGGQHDLAQVFVDQRSASCFENAEKSTLRPRTNVHN
jgi:hypothetical protein